MEVLGLPRPLRSTHSNPVHCIDCIVVRSYVHNMPIPPPPSIDLPTSFQIDAQNAWQPSPLPSPLALALSEDGPT